MKGNLASERFFTWGVSLCVLFSILLSSLYLWSVKRNVLDQMTGIEFIVSSDADFEASLYYTFTDKFSPNQFLQNAISSKDTLRFNFPEKDDMIKKFRLDFGSNLKLGRVEIQSVNLLFAKEKMVLDKEEVFDNLYQNSGSVFIDKSTLSIRMVKSHVPFDPYIVFMPLGTLSISHGIYAACLLMPFLVLLVFYLIKYRKTYVFTVTDFLALIFIISIPLKIAWTTFSTILLCAYGIYFAAYKRKVFLKNDVFFLFAGLFLLLALFGRPSSYAIMDNEFALLLFAVISATLPFSKLRIYKYFIWNMLILNSVILASGLGFLYWFNDFYGLGVSNYFRDIKIYSGNIRDWLYYDHAAFLSFFGLVGLLFAHRRYGLNRMDKKLLVLYHILLISFIVFNGSRICVLIYIVYLFNVLVKLGLRKKIFVNGILFFVVTALFVSNIEKIDQIRYDLWTVSWEAIKESPWVGHGLGTSNAILHDGRFADTNTIAKIAEFNHSHNQFITFLLEIGILGIISLVLSLGYFLYRSGHYKNTTLCLFLLGLGYLFLTESILQTSKPMYVICFLFLLCAIKRNLPTELDKAITS